jgi:WD40 repeat protein
MADLEAEQHIIPITEPVQTFEDHENIVLAVAVFPDKRHMVTGSADRILRLWDLEDGVVLKKMAGHRGWVRAVAVSHHSQMIASADNGEVFVWDRDTGESLCPAIKAHSTYIRSLDFSPDGTMLATGSLDHTTKLWDTETWQLQGNSINCRAGVYDVRYSPSGELLAIATKADIQIWNPRTRKCIANFKDLMYTTPIYAGSNLPLAWLPDATRLLSGGCSVDATIREWDLSHRQQVGDPWDGHNRDINAIAVNSDGTLVASASADNHVRLWRRWDRKTIAIFQHTNVVRCVTFSVDGKRILSGGADNKISEWAVPGHALCDVKACIYSVLSSLT